MTQPATAPPARRHHQPEDGPEGVQRSWPWAAGIIGTGIPAGLLWWLLAPGGMNLLSGNAALASGTNSAGWLPRDLVLAGLFVVAGSLVAVLLSGRKDGGTRRLLVVSVAASGAAAVLAWQTGVLAGLWLGQPEDTSANASVAFSLRSHTVLLLWPAAVAAGYFALRVISLLGKSRDPAASQGAGQDS